MYNSTAHDAQREQHWASQRAAWNLVPQNRGGPGTSAETKPDYDPGRQDTLPFMGVWLAQ